MLNRSRQLFTATRRVPGVFTLFAISCALMVVGCSDGLVAPDTAQVESLSTADGTAVAAPMSKGRSWNNWHVHDGTFPPVIDATGLKHVKAAIFPAIFGMTEAEYVADASLLVYCPDGVDKGMDGGGSKIASGTCQNDLYLIHLKRNKDVSKPGPAGWTEHASGFYYRLTPR